MIQGTPEFARLYAPLAKLTVKLVNDSTTRLLLLADQHTFATLFAAMSTLYGVEKTIQQRAEQDVRPQLKDQEVSRKMFRDLQRDFGADITSKYMQQYLMGCSVHSLMDDNDERMTKLFRFWAEEIESIEGEGYVTCLDQNLERLEKLIDLTLVEKRLLEFATLKLDLNFSKFFSMLGRYSIMQETMLYTMLSDFEDAAIDFALSSDSVLAKSGILTYNKLNHRLSTLDDFWYTTLMKMFTDDKAFFGQFVQKLKKKDNAGSLARFAAADEAVIAKILMNTVEGGDNTTGFNILAYGSGTIDKRSLVYHSLEERGLAGWVANTSRHTRSAPSICYVAQRWVAEHQPDDVLLVEEAVDVLRRNRLSLASLFGMEDMESDSTAGRDEDRKELDAHVLLDNPVVTFWFTKNPTGISQENLGRFIYHCEVKPASRKARREGIEKAIAKLDLPLDIAQDLSKYSELSEQQVKSAARLAELITEEVEERKQVLTSAIDRSQRAFGRHTTEELRTVVTKYSTKYLNLDGQFTPEQIIHSLRKHQRGTLCFWGIPGTGKTQLAEHMAVELDLPIIKKRGSDLLDKYVGGNEQNIAAMFREAGDENGILLLDEADSFLRDRSLARTSWEVSMVNELLQQMEAFKGIFICATNLFEQLDAASLRRFTFKLEFKELRSEARWEMFENEVELSKYELHLDELNELRERVEGIEYLTPGDFATVKRQMLLLDGELTPSQWIEQLESEAKTKLAGIKRNKIGFSN